jgi:hypothetical protein
MSPTTAVPTMTTLPTSVNHTPQNSISDQPHQRSPSHSNINRNNRKSIRVVAEQRRNQLKNFIKSPLGGSKINDKALGRRTTKLWGNKVEELPPNTKTEDLPPIPSLPVSTTVSGRPSAGTVYSSLDLSHVVLCVNAMLMCQCSDIPMGSGRSDRERHLWKSVSRT